MCYGYFFHCISETRSKSRMNALSCINLSETLCDQKSTNSHTRIYMIVCVCVYYNRLVERKKKQHSIFVTKQIEIVQSVVCRTQCVRMHAMIGGRSARALRSFWHGPNTCHRCWRRRRRSRDPRNQRASVSRVGTIVIFCLGKKWVPINNWKKKKY